MWHIAKSWEVLEGQSLEEKVEKMMRPENLRIEAKEGGRWVEMQPN